MISCPECGEPIAWDSWFGTYMCKCGWESSGEFSPNADDAAEIAARGVKNGCVFVQKDKNMSALLNRASNACLTGIGELTEYAKSTDAIKTWTYGCGLGDVPHKLKAKARTMLKLAGQLYTYADAMLTLSS